MFSTNDGPKVVTLVIVTCQPDPDYVRARVIRASLQNVPWLRVLVLKNSSLGIFRYIEIALKLVRLRQSHNPDIYLLTFRGYEILPWLLLVARGKTLIFDEFINAVEWIAYEHKWIRSDGYLCKALIVFYRALLSKCDRILSDTEVHSDLSSVLCGIPREKYTAIPVGTDEQFFSPRKDSEPNSSKSFRVFFYGSILPLHGLDVILKSALYVRRQKDIEFLLIGGTTEHKHRILEAARMGANISYKRFVPFEELSNEIQNASLCLAGPFGNTFQSQFVITGKTYQFLACSAPTVIGMNRATRVFTDKVDSLVIPQGNSKALAEAILWGYRNRQLLKSIGEAGRKLYVSQFSTQAISTSFSKLILEATDIHPSHD